MAENESMLFLLGLIIKELKEDLESYLKHPGAKEYFVKRKHGHINNLQRVYQSFEINNSKNSEAVCNLVKIMDGLEVIDPQITGFNVNIRIKPTGENFAYVNINPFENER